MEGRGRRDPPGQRYTLRPGGFRLGRDTSVERIGAQLEAGTVWLNEIHQYSPAQAFGGHKQSGIGCENSLHGLMEYTNWHTITLNSSGGLSHPDR